MTSDESIITIKSCGSLGPNIKYTVNNRQKVSLIRTTFSSGLFNLNKKINESRSFKH